MKTYKDYMNEKFKSQFLVDFALICPVWSMLLQFFKVETLTAHLILTLYS